MWYCVIFLIGIGYAFGASQCIIVPMISHTAERFITRKLVKNVGNYFEMDGR